MSSLPTLSACLHDLSVGESATLSSYGSITAAFRQQLMSMGLTRGARVTVVARAPLGDPVSLSVRGALLCLRQNEVAPIEWVRCE